MTISYDKFFVPTVLGIAASTLLTIPATVPTILLRGARIRFVNTSAAVVAVTAYAVPAAGTATASNAFVSGKVIAANDYLDVDVPIMPTATTLQALAGAATSITAHMLSGSYFA